MTDSVVVEGLVKIRDGKKWKSRWVVLRKPSPVADCLVVLVYKERGERASGQRERSSVTLEHIYGLEPCVAYEGLSLGLSLTILCLTQSVALGFDCKETLQVWEIRLRYSLGEVHRFAVGVLPGTKVETGPATLYLCNNLLVIARDLPPVIIGQWNLLDLRRYGPVTNGFVFEGGTRCGYWAGVFFLSCAEGEQISFLFDCIVRGISPSRGPFGLRPLLPDPNTSPVSVEERLNHETQELEKRLSMLSHCSHHSTVSTSSYCTSMAGDDRSISGSSDTSDTSQSDSSMGSRLAIWTDPSSSSTAPTEGGNQSGQKSTLLLVDEKLPITMGGGGARLSVSTATTSSSSSTNKQGSRSRRLQEIGRQSSSDSGIATGSHSSYSGSFSSYTSSLDVTGSGGGVGVGGGVVGSSSGAGTGAGVGEDYASVLNLQTASTTLGSGGGGGTTTTGTASAALPERTLCTCPPCPGHEYQVPSTALRYLYDTPRSLMMLLPQLPGSTPTCSSRCAHDEEDEEEGQGQGQVQPTPSGGAQVSCTTYGHAPQGAQLCCITGSHVGCGQLDRLQEQQHRPDGCSALKDSEASQGKAAAAVSAAAGGGGGRLSRGNSSEGAPPGVEGVEVCDICTPRAIYTSCPICGGLKGTPVLTPGVPSVPDKKKQRCKGEPAYEVMESRTTERGSEAEEKSKYELMGSYGHQRIPHIDLEGGVFVFPPDVSLMSERPKGDGVIYVNIPISPTSKKQLNYMELELQEATTTAVRGRGSTKYAQIDITATETAHKVGTQHALGREEGLLKLEQKRRGGLPQ